MTKIKYKLEVDKDELYEIIQAVVASSLPTECAKVAKKIIDKLPAISLTLRANLWQMVGRQWYANVASWNQCHEEGDSYYRIDQRGSVDPKDWEIIEVDETIAQR